MLRSTLFLLMAVGMVTLWAEGEIIRLKNGVELQCEILECSEENGIKVKRLDNGGVFELRWEHILDADAKAIKYARGYTDEEAKPILIRAKRVVLKNGTFEDGIQVESDRPGMLCLRRRGKHYYFRQPDVTEIQAVELEAKDVFTLDELFQDKIEDGAPETAQDYFALGVFCESVTYYPKALELFEKVCELDPEYKPDVMDQKLRVMAAKIAETDATKILDEIRGLIYRKKFALALARIEYFETIFPNSVQMGYKEQLKSETLTKRHNHFQQSILTDYFTFLDRAVYKIATDKEMDLDAALDFAAEDLGPAIRQKLAEDVYEISIEEVEDLWANRRGGSSRKASYGTGTFILGPDRAKSVPDAPESETEKEAAAEEAPKTMDEKLKQRIDEIRKQQAKGKGKKRSKIRMDEIGRSPEAWWNTESVMNRKRFLIAYYAEESGDMKIMTVRFNQCSHCHGKGFLERMSTGEEDEKIPCEVCKTLGIERLVVFR